MLQKVEKVHNFPDPPHQDVLDFFEFVKKWKFDAPPLDLIWEKVEIGKILNFGSPPSEKIITLKHLTLPKNHFKTNLFFVQLKHLKSLFTFGEKLIIWPPPITIILILHFLIFHYTLVYIVFAENTVTAGWGSQIVESMLT